ncbi:MAG TPA: L,D-transpeptidase family protein [Ilumatobacteraceae bacterium]|nr:L,D-transpeptidase family protein [Ilumatobacteraceae bacterium]
MTKHTRRNNRPASPVQRDVRRAIAVLGVGAVLIGVISFVQTIFKDSPSQATAAALNSQPATSPSTTAAPTADAPISAGDTGASTPVPPIDLAQTGQQDLIGDEPSPTDAGCKIDKRELRIGDSGTSVTCMQQALIDIGYLTGTASGTFDNPTFSAVNKLQKDKDMFVDGVVGRETAISLNIWPDEASLVIHTPPPAAGAVDLLGYPLSYVATSGPDAPPLPANSGSGKRVVYDRAGQRVWAVDKNDRVIRSWLVSGSKYNNEVPGKHVVYSRSEVSTAWNGKALLPHMIRYTKTKIGAIGFHGIPRHVSDGSKYEKDTELGTRLSGGCTRQADLDADFMWDFAQIGTPVIVT